MHQNEVVVVMRKLVAMGYRLRASALARQADWSSDDTEKMRIIHEALSWIQLAENDELISQVTGKTPDLPS